MAARDAMLRDGVPRSAIDAGYPLNGNDLYRDPPPGRRETEAKEAGIPMITSAATRTFTIAAVPLPGSMIMPRSQRPGPFGLGQREIYVVKSPMKLLPLRPIHPANPH